jgi:hypothetical protein
LLMRGLFRLHVSGAEKLPDTGAFVITSNHVSDLDGSAIAAALPWSQFRRLYWAGDLVRMCSNPLNRLFCQAIHVFPVDANHPGAVLEAHTNFGAASSRASSLPPLPRSRHSTVQSGLYFAAILIAHLLGSRELLPGLARLWMWISLLSPHRKAASQLLMEQVSFGGSERVLQARFEARKQIAERPLGANRG